jgi:hypothetical protein
MKTTTRRLALATVLLLASCARLPDYATPKGRVVDAASLDASDLIPFRTLERGDFRGSGPPAEFACSGVAPRERQKVTRALEQALATMLDQSRRFDEDTSLGHRPERQREWGRRVKEELERTQGGGP